MGGQLPMHPTATDRRRNAPQRDDQVARGPSRRGRRGVIDARDLGILDILSIDARASTKYIAEQVGLTDATVAARIRELVANDVLRVRAVLDWDRAGLRSPIVFFLRVHGRSSRAVAQDLLADPQVLSVSDVFGGADIVARVLLADPADAMTFAETTLGATQGLEIVMSLLDVDVPKYINGLHAGQTPAVVIPTFPTRDELLDDVDLGMLEHLVQDARQSLRQIARSLDVSEHTVRSRLRRMEDAGLVSIRAQVDPQAINGGGESAYLALRVQNASVQEVVDDLVNREEFWSVDRTVGEYNVLALVHRETRAELAAVVDELRAGEGVERSETWMLSSMRFAEFPWGRF
jgi:DNA-binding Lrp family transcriptional regulator